LRMIQTHEMPDDKPSQILHRGQGPGCAFQLSQKRDIIETKEWPGAKSAAQGETSMADTLDPAADFEPGIVPMTTIDAMRQDARWVESGPSSFNGEALRTRGWGPSRR